MKKVGKTILIAGVALTMGIGAFGVINITNMQNEENKLTIQAYNHTPTNILDNVFERNDVKYLPFIYDSPMLADGVTPKTISRTEVTNAFSSRNLEVEISEGDIRTGTQISVKGSSDVYTVVIYGDVDCDGVVDAMDAQDVLDCYLGGGTGLNEVRSIAANVENDDDGIDAMDAQRIIDFYLGTETKLVLNEPSHIGENDTTPPVIKFNGQVVTGTQTEKLKVGDTFKPVVTAMDNIDGDLTKSIIKTGDTVNTNVADTYRVIYTVSDSNGNTTTVTIVVVVEDSSGEIVTPTPTLTDIEIANEVTLYTESSKGISKGDLTYTVVPIKFLYGTQTLSPELIAGQIDKLKVELPEAKLLGGVSKENVIQSKYFDKDNNEIKDNYEDIVAIGFAIRNKNVKIDRVDKISLNVGSNSHELTVNIEYANDNRITEITFKDSEAEGYKGKYAGIIDNNYIVRKYTGKEEGIFTLGEIISREGERPIKKEEMQPVTDTENNLSIYYEYNEDGILLVKGTLKDATTNKSYRADLTTNIAGIESIKEVFIQAIDAQGQLDITFEKTVTTEGNDISINKIGNERLLMKVSDDDSADIDVLSKYITISENSNIDIQKQKANKRPANDNEVVKYLNITTEQDGPRIVEVVITLYADCPGLEKEVTIIVNIKN